ncbi:hypothetical protein BCR44DRAFT_344570, partial [Catenaria anguillulae PL171]
MNKLDAMHGNQHQDDCSVADHAGQPSSISPLASDASPPQEHMAAVESGQSGKAPVPAAQSSRIMDSSEYFNPFSADGTVETALQVDGNSKPGRRPFLTSAELAAIAKIVGPSSFGTWPRLVTEQDIDRVVQVTNLRGESSVSLDVLDSISEGKHKWIVRT